MIKNLWYAVLNSKEVKKGKITSAKRMGRNLVFWRLENGEVACIEKWKIGNLDQSLIIYGRDIDNPAMLFLHGGPGFSEFPYVNYINKKLEKHLTFIYWEQRGSVKSPTDSITDKTINLNQLVKDTIEVAEKVKKKFKKEKIYLLGHSWGTLPGILAAHKRPDLFHAYIGISQIVNWLESDKLAHKWALDKAKKEKNIKAIDELKKVVPYSSKDFKKKQVLMKWVANFGGGMTHVKKSMFHTFIYPLIKVREFTFTDKLNFFPSGMKSMNLLWEEIIRVNLFKKIQRIKIPVYILHGKFDQQVSYVLSKQYFNKLKSPGKKFYTFDRSAHGVIWEEPKKYKKIIINDILNKR
ncbi:alpha/beta fold hydrolase [Spirochaetota bacterium]